MERPWDDERMQMAQQIVVERFAQNCVSGHFVPTKTVDEMETTVRSDLFDSQRSLVVDRDVIGLNEPFAYVYLTRAQVDEFSTAPSEALRQAKAATTLNRAAARMARMVDAVTLASNDELTKIRRQLANVQMPDPEIPSKSLYEAAKKAEIEADDPLEKNPVPVEGPKFNEGLVDAVYGAVLRLEHRGYFSNYHLVLGQRLWQELHRPTGGSMVLPRHVIEPTLIGGGFHRSTTLGVDTNAGEALLVSLDGPTLDCVVAGDPAYLPRLEFLRVQMGVDPFAVARAAVATAAPAVAKGAASTMVAAPPPVTEEIYLFRIRIRFAPRVREIQAIVRLKMA